MVLETMREETIITCYQVHRHLLLHGAASQCLMRQQVLSLVHYQRSHVELIAYPPERFHSFLLISKASNFESLLRLAVWAAAKLILMRRNDLDCAGAGLPATKDR